jgi:dienelactone hydrolase
VAGENLTIASANPRNYRDAITAHDQLEPVEIDAKLFLPTSDTPSPVVIIVPGSLGVGPNHESHAETLVADGFSVCVIDPFGPRSVDSTVANQTAYSFAASAFDVLATFRTLAERDDVEATQIAAQGHSRGGSAVATAAMRRFADPIIGPNRCLAAAYAVYPWSGHQFIDPSIGSTRLRAIIGSHDEWCSVQETQGLVNAIRSTGADATMHIVWGAHHSFDRLEAPYRIDEASVAPTAPTVMLAHDGSMIAPGSDTPDPNLTDRDLFIAAAEGGFGRTGAVIGGVDDQPERFRADMLAFHRMWSS